MKSRSFFASFVMDNLALRVIAHEAFHWLGEDTDPTLHLGSSPFQVGRLRVSLPQTM